MTVPTARTRRASWLLLAIWGALTIALVAAVPSLPWQRALAELRHAGFAWVALAIGLNLVILPLWALEWGLLVPVVRVTFARMFEIVSVTAAVLNSVPFLAGEASAVALLIGRGGLGRGAALSVLAMDQLLVAFAKLATLALAAWLAPIPDWLRHGLATLVLAFGGMLIALLPLAHRWRQLRDRLDSRGTPARQTLAQLVAWGEHLDVLRAPGRISRAAVLALIKKAAELAAIIVIQAAFGLDPSVPAAALVLAGLALSTLLPIAPANLGVYEATVFAVYRYVGVPAETALGIAVVQHLCFLLPSVATGYLTLTLGEVRRRSPAA